MNKGCLKPRGFTLIEILVVIAIIGILSSIIYVGFGEARENARNKALLTEMKETQLVVELYKAQNGKYPPAINRLTCGNGVIADTASADCYSGEDKTYKLWPIIEGIVPEFTSDMASPLESANPNCHLIYEVDAGGDWYKLTAENCYVAATASEGVQPDNVMARCPSTCADCGGATLDATSPDFYNSFAIYSAGGYCE